MDPEPTPAPAITPTPLEDSPIQPAPPLLAPTPDRVPLWLFIITLLLLGAVVFMQRPRPLPADKIDQLATGLLVDRPPVSEYVLIGKMLIALKSAGGGDTSAMLAPIMSQADALAEASHAAQDKFRAAIIAGEVGGFDAIESRFNELLPGLDPDSPLRNDIATITDAYRNASPDRDLQDSSAADDLIKRHGWIGELALDQAAGAAAALVQDKSPAPFPIDNFRAGAATDGFILIGVLAAFGLLALLAILAGFILHIVGWVMVATGRLRPFRPGRGSRVSRRIFDAAQLRAPVPARIWIETFALFLAGFLTLKLIGEGLHYLAPDAAWPGWLLLIGQWALAPLVLWPAMRSASWDRLRFEIGWHRGTGIAREVWAGIAGYLAMLPVLIAVALIMVIIKQLTGDDSLPIRDNPVLGRAGGGLLEVLLLATLVTIWAPLVEETLFRGVVFRFFRRRWGLFAAALGSALLFAGMHGYVLQGLVVVGTLGFTFALMREWRGSLIPSMTAHCLHNSVAFILILTISHLAKG